jgi:hypothetical protein
MFDQFISHLQVLSKADSLIARIWLAVMARRFAMFAFAGLIAVFGLAMADVAGFFALQSVVSTVWAATIVALIDFAIAAVMALIALTAKPGPELDLALEVRGMAIKSLQADARDLEAGVKAYGQQLRDAKDRIAGIVGNPLDMAAQKLLLPAVIAIVKGLRARHGKAGNP